MSKQIVIYITVLILVLRLVYVSNHWDSTQTHNVTLKSNKSDSLSIGYTDKRKHQQKIVLLAGPHKTASTSIQTNIAQWCSLGILKDWCWPYPSEYFFISSAKSFALLLWVLFNATTNNYDVGAFTKTEFTVNATHMQILYRETFRQAWNNNKSIVFGSEHTDFVNIEDKFHRAKIIDNLMKLMPCYPCNKNQFEVVVTYRLPRVKHLLSIWHQFTKMNNNIIKNLSFSTFIKDHLHSHFYWLNALGIADTFLKKHISVIIIDTSGIAQENLDLSLMIACDVLKVSCQNNNIVGLHESDSHIKRMNVHRKRGKVRMDLAKNQLQEIDDILLRFDCKYNNVQQIAKILYQHNLFSSCVNNSSNNSDYVQLSVNQTINAIRNVIK